MQPICTVTFLQSSQSSAFDMFCFLIFAMLSSVALMGSIILDFWFPPIFTCTTLCPLSKHQAFLTNLTRHTVMCRNVNLLKMPTSCNDSLK